MTTIVRASVAQPGGPSAGAGAKDHDVTGPARGAGRPGIGPGIATASLALAGTGVASILGGGAVGARLGAAGIGRGAGLVLGVAALAGAAYLMFQGAGTGTTEYLVGFREQPDLSGVAPGDVYAVLRAHHERNAPAVERELATLQEEGRVRGYSGIVGANGFVVEVVTRHRAEVEQRLGAIREVGAVEAAPLR